MRAHSEQAPRPTASHRLRLRSHGITRITGRVANSKWLLRLCMTPWSLLGLYISDAGFDIVARLANGDQLSAALIEHELLVERLIPAIQLHPMIGLAIATVVGANATLVVWAFRQSKRLASQTVRPFDTFTAPDPLIGRNEEQGWLVDHLVRGERCLAVWAPAGTGRTALVHSIAAKNRVRHHFADGMMTLDCSHRRPATILSMVIGRFSPSGRPLAGSNLEHARNICRRRLAGKRALIVLRNVASSFDLADIVEPLTASGLSVVLTLDRQPSTPIIPDECVRELPPLRWADGKDLFERIYEDHASASLTGTQRGFVAEIVALLGCHPRRICETALAAARQHRDLHQLRDELLPRSADASQHYSEGTLLQEPSSPNGSNSVLSLAPSARELAIALAVFATGEASRQAFLAVGREIVGDAPRSLAILVEHGFVHAHTELALPQSADRERLVLQRSIQVTLVRSFLHQSRVKMQMRAYLALADYYARYAASQPSDVLERDLDNMLGVLDAALLHVDNPAWSEAITKLTVALHRYWLSHCPVAVATSYMHEAMLAAISGQSHHTSDQLASIAAEVFGLAASVFRRAGKWDMADAACKQGLELCSDDRLAGQFYLERARAFYGLSYASLEIGAAPDTLPKAEATVLDAISVASRLRDGALAAQSLSLQSLIHIAQSDPAAAKATCGEASEWMLSIPEDSEVYWPTRGEVFGTSALLCQSQGLLSDAAILATAAADAFREAQDDVGLAQAYALEGEIAILSGRDAVASAALASALQLAREVRADYLVRRVAGILALIEWERRLDRARVGLPARPLQVLEISGEAARAVRAALTAQSGGHLEDAERHYMRALEPLVAAHNRRGQGLVTSNLSLLKASQGYRVTANRLRAASDNFLTPGSAA